MLNEDNVYDFKKRVIRSFNDYLKIIKEFKSEENLVWFRGQEKASFRLIPGAMRECFEFEDQFGSDIIPKRVESYNNRGNIVTYINVEGL